MREKNQSPQDGHTESTDARRSSRVKLEAVVHYEINGSEFINLSSNISTEGIFIRNLAPPTVGTELRIRVQLPADIAPIPVNLVGRVVHIADNVGEEDRGMGVEFQSVQADSLDAVRYFVKTIYCLDNLDSNGFHPDEQSGKYTYAPGPRHSLRLHPNALVHKAIPPQAAAGKLMQYMLLILVGVLLGSGMVLFFFLF